MPSKSQPLKDSHEVSGKPIVRETVCKTILNRSGLSDYSLNCYTGCRSGFVRRCLMSSCRNDVPPGRP
jgi:hypothetical protein